MDWRKIGLVALLAVLIGAGLLYRNALDVGRILDGVRSLGPWAPVVYIAVYLVAPPLLLPGAPLTIAGGALFGPLWGTAYTAIGATGGACLAFLIARYLAADWVERKSRGILKRTMRGVEEEGWKFVAFTRLVPLFPFNLLNYALGLTRIPFWHYALASFLCMLPGIWVYSFLGYAGREAAVGSENMVLKISAALGLLLFFSMLPRLLRSVRRAPAPSGPSE
jgi:uncharacterized membrane protein YdjX (TVP38/TMEM64 family)